MLDIIRQIQKSVPDMTVMATGFSWLREFAPMSSGGIQKGWFRIAGFGRQSLAYRFARYFDQGRNGQKEILYCLQQVFRDNEGWW